MTDTAPFPPERLGPQARAALPWLGLFRGGVFEVVLLTTGRLDPRDWEAARAELQDLELLHPDRSVEIGGRPFLRFASRLAALAHNPDPSEDAREQLCATYGVLNLSVRQGLGGDDPSAAQAVLEREQDNLRQAVEWALALGDKATAAALGGTYGLFLERAGRGEEQLRWAAWLDGALATRPPRDGAEEG